eukprot:TRINITY_DN86_c0_g1_i1.p1 TRINITY_DN86_c0_g1~~TRINITY_DN86_c0_g1_i1.p1  ORF type:complete len:146 (+),score=45.14 TRINITY_DN86_c0_g1_i1:299-736(+)
MSTRAVASAVFPLPIDRVWSHLRDFTFPGKLISTISECKIEDNKHPDQIGAVRLMKWKSGESRRDRLIELSDQHYRIVWEMVDSEPVAELTAAITTVRLIRITEGNQTLVEWSSDFSNDIDNKFISFNQKAFHENLVEMRAAMTK